MRRRVEASVLAMVLAACGGGATGGGSQGDATGATATAPAPVEGSVVAGGQTIVSADGALTVEVPPGNPVVTVSPGSFDASGLHEDFEVLGSWELGPSGARFDPPVTLTFRGGIPDATPLVFVLLIDGDQLRVAPETVVEVGDDGLVVGAEVARFSEVVVMRHGASDLVMRPAKYTGPVGSEISAFWELFTWSPALDAALGILATPEESFDLFADGWGSFPYLAVTTAVPFAAGSVQTVSGPTTQAWLEWEEEDGYVVYGTGEFLCAAPGPGTFGFRVQLEMTPEALGAYLVYQAPGAAVSGGPAAVFELVSDGPTLVDLGVRATADCREIVDRRALLDRAVRHYCEQILFAGIDLVSCAEPVVPQLESLEAEVEGEDLVFHISIDPRLRPAAEWDEDQIRITPKAGETVYCFDRVLFGETDTRCTTEDGADVDGVSVDSDDSDGRFVIRGACGVFDLRWLDERCVGETEVEMLEAWFFRSGEETGTGASVTALWEPQF